MTSIFLPVSTATGVIREYCLPSTACADAPGAARDEQQPGQHREGKLPDSCNFDVHGCSSNVRHGARQSNVT